MPSGDSKLDQAPGRGEPAGVEVESPEMVLEVDVHPFAPRPPSLFDSEPASLGPAFIDQSHPPFGTVASSRRGGASVLSAELPRRT
jgi:hypothetical protein